MWLHVAYSQRQTTASNNRPTGLTAGYPDVPRQRVSGRTDVVVVKVLYDNKVASLKSRDLEVTH